MIITCPHCQTRYQVAAEAIGAGGRQVRCAQCAGAWSASPPRPVVVRPIPSPVPAEAPPIAEADEDRLDAAFAAEAERTAPVTRPSRPAEITAAPVDAATVRRRQRAFFRRQNTLIRRLPLARVRRAARTSAVLLLLALLLGGYGLRTDIVRQFPGLAEVYEGLGLPVNVVGLEFRAIHTVRGIKGGADVLSAIVEVVAVGDRLVPVPPVIVTLLDAAGAPLYEWSVTPPARELAPGETVEVTTQLTDPPAGAQRIRLSFGATRLQPATGTIGVEAAGADSTAPADQGPEALEPVSHGPQADSADAQEGSTPAEGADHGATGHAATEHKATEHGDPEHAPTHHGTVDHGTADHAPAAASGSHH